MPPQNKPACLRTDLSSMHSAAQLHIEFSLFAVALWMCGPTTWILSNSGAKKPFQNLLKPVNMAQTKILDQRLSFYRHRSMSEL
jgi:hypothetical protein